MIHTENMHGRKASAAGQPAKKPQAGCSFDLPLRPRIPQPIANSDALATRFPMPASRAIRPLRAQELSKFPRVTGVRHWSSGDSSTVVLDLEDQVQYEAHRLAGPDRIYFDLRDTQLAPDLIGKSIEVGDTFVSRIRMAQPVAGMTRIVLETKANSTFSVSLEPNPYRLVVEVRKIGRDSESRGESVPQRSEAEKNKLAIVIPPPDQRRLATAGARAQDAHRGRCRPRRMGPGNGGTPRLAGKRSGPRNCRSGWASCSKAAWAWK